MTRQKRLGERLVTLWRTPANVDKPHLFGVFIGVADTMLVSCCFVVWILYRVNLLY